MWSSVTGRFNVGSLVILCVLHTASLFAQVSSTLTVSLHDVGTNGALTGKGATVRMDAESKPMQSGNGVYAITARVLELCRTKSLSFVLEAPDKYVNRAVPIEAASVCRVPARRYDFHLQASGEIKTFGYLHAGEIYLTASDSDKAIAYYEPLVSALDEGSDALELRCLAREYYAFGLQNAALKLGYATADRATEMYEYLKNNLSQCKSYTQRTKQYYEEAGAQLKIKKVENLYALGRYSEAGEIAANQLSEAQVAGFEQGVYAPRPSAWLATAAGISFLKAGEAAEQEGSSSNAAEYYQKAQKFLANVESPDAMTKQNIKILSLKMAAIQQ